MKNIIPYLKSATALNGYHLFVEFEDGTKGVLIYFYIETKEYKKFWNKISS